MYYYNIVTLLFFFSFCIKLNIILAYAMDSINNSLPTNCSDLIRQQQGLLGTNDPCLYIQSRMLRSVRSLQFLLHTQYNMCVGPMVLSETSDMQYMQYAYYSLYAYQIFIMARLFKLDLVLCTDCRQGLDQPTIAYNLFT